MAPVCRAGHDGGKRKSARHLGTGRPAGPSSTLRSDLQKAVSRLSSIGHSCLRVGFPPAVQDRRTAARFFRSVQREMKMPRSGTVTYGERHHKSRGKKKLDKLSL